MHRDLLSGPLQASLSHSPAFPEKCPNLPYKAKLRFLISPLKILQGVETAGAERHGPASHFHSDSAGLLGKQIPVRVLFFSSLWVMSDEGLSVLLDTYPSTIAFAARCLGSTDYMPLSLEALGEVFVDATVGTERSPVGGAPAGARGLWSSRAQWIRAGMQDRKFR